MDSVRIGSRRYSFFALSVESVDQASTRAPAGRSRHDFDDKSGNDATSNSGPETHRKLERTVTRDGCTREPREGNRNRRSPENTRRAGGHEEQTWKSTRHLPARESRHECTTTGWYGGHPLVTRDPEALSQQTGRLPDTETPTDSVRQGNLQRVVLVSRYRGPKRSGRP